MGGSHSLLQQLVNTRKWGVDRCGQLGSWLSGWLGGWLGSERDSGGESATGDARDASGEGQGVGQQQRVGLMTLERA